MKAEMKAVVASLVVIALALTAVSGVTYSWFSDTEEAKIDVSTAKIDISGVFTDARVADPAAGASATVDGSNLTLSNISAFKTVNAKYTVKNESSVDTKYRMYVQLIGDLDVSKFKMYVVESSTGEPVLDTPLSFVDGIAYAVGGATSGVDLLHTTDEINYTVVIEFGNLTSEDMGKSFKLFMITEAYQSDYTFTAPIGSSGETSIPETAKTHGAIISGVAPAEAGSSADPATVKVNLSPEAVTAAMGSGSSLTLKTEMKEVGGNPVLSIGFTDPAVNDFGKDVTVTVTVPGTSADEFKVVFLGSGEQPTNVTKKVVGPNVEITFTTTHFSDYMITVEDIVAIADTDSGVGVYSSLPEAFKNVVSGGDVNLVSDVSVSKPIEIKDDVNLNLNGKTITGEGSSVFYVLGGNVSFDGSGIITSIDIADNGYVLCLYSNQGKDVSLEIGKDVVVTTEVSYGITLFAVKETKLDLTIYGTVESKDTSAISGNGSAEYETTNIVIENSAVIKSTGCPAIYHPQAGTLTVYGTVDGGIEAKAGNIQVNADAVISSNGMSFSHKYSGNGISSNGYAIAIVSNAAYKGPAHLISDKATINGSIAYLFDDKTITGEIAALAKTSDDRYYFDTFELATEFAPEKSTIVLLKGVDVQKITIEKKTVTLDLNGHNIKLAEKIYVQSTGSLDIIGKGTISSETQGIRVQGSDNPENRNHLTVGKDVTINANSLTLCI